MGNYLFREGHPSSTMAARSSPLGMDHPTVVPTNAMDADPAAECTGSAADRDGTANE